MDKEDVVCVYTHTHTQWKISHKKERNSAICSNMDLGTTILSEISHTEKDTYHKISLREGM